MQETVKKLQSETKNQQDRNLPPLRSLFRLAQQTLGPSWGGKSNLRVGSSYLSESKFDSSLFEGLGKLLKLLKVTGLLQAGSINSLWCWLALWKCLNWGCCYRACWGCWLWKEQESCTHKTPQCVTATCHKST